MTRKIMGGIMLITSIALLLSSLAIAGILNRYFSRRLEEELMTEANLIGRGAMLSGTDYFKDNDTGDLHILWADSSGRVIYDSKGDKKDISGSPDFQEALREGHSSSSRISLNIDRSSLNYSLRLSDGSVLRVSDMHLSLKDQFFSIIPSLAAFLALASVGALIAAHIVSRRIVKPINSIDLDDPKPDPNMPELRPLLRKLRTQNRRVSKQLDMLRKSREQFDLITESMSEGIIAADPKLNILSCNSGALRLLGAEAAPEGHSIFSLNKSEEFRKCIQNAAGGIHSEAVISTAGGSCEVIASPAKTSDGKGGIVVFIMDVTEKQKLEAMRREFTSNVSHELKTPLTTIYGTSDLLAGGMAKAEDVPLLSSNIRSEAERMINLINDIISLSKLDESSADAEKEDVDLFELAADIVRRLEPNSSARNITGSVNGEHIIYYGCRTILDEIIANLCDNAVKYGKTGGHYEVRVSHIPKSVFITVSDNGIGIPPEAVSRIFERFYRVDKSRSRKIKGTGLGLSIVKHGVLFHGGTVRCDSTPGKGTVFTIELPVLSS